MSYSSFAGRARIIRIFTSNKPTLQAPSNEAALGCRNFEDPRSDEPTSSVSRHFTVEVESLEYDFPLHPDT
jgi:hypothetical protein